MKQGLEAASNAAQLCVLLLRLRDTPCNGKLRQISDSGLGKAVKRLTNHGDAEVAEAAKAVVRGWTDLLAAAKQAKESASASDAVGIVPSSSMDSATTVAPGARLAPAANSSTQRMGSTPLVQASSSMAVLPPLLPMAPGEYKDYTMDTRASGRVLVKPDAVQRPFWVLPDNRIILESHSPVYAEAEALLIAIAEPVSRTRFLHEYQLTDYSLYAGASMGLKTSEILEAMARFSKTELPPKVRQYIHNETSRYGKVKLVMRAERLFIECCGKPEVLAELLRDPELEQWRPLARLKPFQLRVTGTRGKKLVGSVRFLPAECICAFDAYRRVEMRYGSMSGLRPAPRDLSREAPEAARCDLRFRLAFATEEDVKRFHTTLALDYVEGNPAYNWRNPDHELMFCFASEADRRRFWVTALPRLRAQAQLSPSEHKALDEALGPPPTGAVRLGVDGTGAGDSAPREAADAADVEALRRAEDVDDASEARIEEFEVDPSRVKEVKARCRQIRWPLLEEYDFRNDTENPELPIELKPDSKIRDYQEQALKRCFGNHRARSGIIVLPCGAGKTLVGIVAACTVKRSTLVLCNSSVSVEQWYQQFLMWAQIDKDRVTRFIAGSKEPLHKDACVLVSTYNMIGYTGRRSAEARAIMEDVSDREWGLVILDEVHVAPADTFLTCMTTRTRSRCKLGLTATLVREDGKIDVLNAQIGPKLYEANWLDLQQRGFIATVSCAEVWCEMTPEFYREYLRASTPMQRVLYALNPNKFRSCEYLMRFHERRGDKVIIFSDNVFALREYAKKLQRPHIDGDVGQNERMAVLQQFKTGGRYSTVIISKVGDTSIDLPEANVIIQIASHFGARRQEAQRLGRILRPKARTGQEFNAFFYTLISRDTQEMYYSGKRQQFLVDQGYAFKVIPQLDLDAEEGLAYGTKKEQRDLLSYVISTNETELRGADEREDAEISRSTGAEDGGVSGGGITRKRGSMAELSGAGSIVYTEVAQPAAQRLRSEYQKRQQANAKARAAQSVQAQK